MNFSKIYQTNILLGYYVRRYHEFKHFWVIGTLSTKTIFVHFLWKPSDKLVWQSGNLYHWAHTITPLCLTLSIVLPNPAWDWPFYEWKNHTCTQKSEQQYGEVTKLFEIYCTQKRSYSEFQNRHFSSEFGQINISPSVSFL